MKEVTIRVKSSKDAFNVQEWFKLRGRETNSRAIETGWNREFVINAETSRYEFKQFRQWAEQNRISVLGYELDEVKENE